MPNKILAKEISWLSFNERVLQEAADNTNPIKERLNFLGIYSNNLDEFYRVRVATLKRISDLGKNSDFILGFSVSEVLKQIYDITVRQQKFFDEVYINILDELKKHNISIIKETEVNGIQTEFLKDYFYNYVRPQLVPIMLNQIKEAPQLKDDMAYLAVAVISKKKNQSQYALIQIPSDVLPRFIELPSPENHKCLIFLDDVIRFGLSEVFHMIEIDNISAYTIKVTKDAELDINDDINQSYIDKVALGIKKRKEGQATRFIYDRNMPQGLLKLFQRKLNIGKTDTLISGGRYHNFKDFLKFPLVGIEKNSSFFTETIQPKQIDYNELIFKAIRKKDIFLYFPYHSFGHFVDLLRDASIDPYVKSIKITLYRLAKNSMVINALLNAARNGKKVEVVIEIQARFDEEANLNWSNLLHEEGIKVIYGVPGLKVHAKICLIERHENNKPIFYSCISTGNFNETTSKIYTDFMLMTADPKITREITKVFDFFNRNYKKDNFNHLFLSPFDSRKKLISLIKQEISNAQNGINAYIHIKVNNLVDNEINEYLYLASKAGVEIVLLIRGMFTLQPDKHSNIEAYGLVDKLLEHSRMLIFANAGNPKVFIASSDLMTRNLDRRVEVICPIYDEDIKTQLIHLFSIHYKENVKARILDNKLSNQLRKMKKNEKPFRSQLETYLYLSKLADK